MEKKDDFITYPLLKELWKKINRTDKVDKDTKNRWIKEVAALKFNSCNVTTLPKVKCLDTISVVLNNGASLNAMNLSEGFQLSIDQGLAHIFKKHGYNPQIEMNQRRRADFLEDLIKYCRNIYPYSLAFLQDYNKANTLRLSIDKGLAKILKKHGYNPQFRKPQQEYVNFIEDIVSYCRDNTKYKVIDYSETSLWATFKFNVDGMKTSITHKYELLPDKNGAYHFRLHRKGYSAIDISTIGPHRYRDKGNDSVPNIAFVKDNEPKVEKKVDDRIQRALDILDEI